MRSIDDAGRISRRTRGPEHSGRKTVAALTDRGLTLNANLETTSADWKQGPVVLMTHGTLAHGGVEIMQTLQSADVISVQRRIDRIWVRVIDARRTAPPEGEIAERGARRGALDVLGRCDPSEASVIEMETIADHSRSNANWPILLPILRICSPSARA